MSQLEKLSRRHYLISKLSAAFLYALAVAVALNFSGVLVRSMPLVLRDLRRLFNQCLNDSCHLPYRPQ